MPERTFLAILTFEVLKHFPISHSNWDAFDACLVSLTGVHQNLFAFSWRPRFEISFFFSFFLK